MAERGRLLIVLLAVLIISSLIPHSNAERTDSNAIEIQINELEESYIAGDTIRFNPILLNPSNATQFHNDPSCDYVFEIYDNDNAMVFSSASKCKKIVQAIELLEGEQLELMTHLWDFTDNRGLELASGTYTSIVRHSFLPISDSSTFNYYASSTVPNDIEIKHNIIDISNEHSSAYLIQLIIHNPTPKKFDVGGLNCDVVIESGINRHILSDCLKNIHTLHPYENLYLGSHIFQGDWLEQSDEIKIEFTGSNRYNPVQLPNTHILLQGDNSSENVINVTGLNYRLINETEGPYLSIVAEYAPAKLLEIDNCLMDFYIANDYGILVEDEQINFCRLLPVESVDSNEKHQYEVYRWKLTDEQNCNIDIGKYTVVLGGKLFSSVDFFQQLPNTFTKCITKDFEVDISNQVSEDFLYNSVKISGQENFRITSKCISIIHVEFNSALVDDITETSCEYNIGSFMSPPNGIFEFEQKIELPPNLVEATEILLRNTIYSERIYLNSDTFYLESDGLTENPEASFAVSGTWELIEHKEIKCWVLNSPNSAYILEGDNHDSIWSPKQGWYGEYAITEHQPDSSYCSQFGLPVVTINDIFIEEHPVVFTESVVTDNNDSRRAITVTEATAIGVTSSSILLGLLIFVSNTESLRIPVTSAGLWVLALVGKTHETSDGRFQRGRLIGYLTANPGCHFRALMAALNMSNGQITHHLRLLENQELIWRISDGRFVRYYPLNNSLYPGMNPDDLPVPPLSPDPRSLQGKILTILDDEHQLGEFPTQAELAKKLEKSQQLISHHLRTLQKYGLVEKRKMGIKNRYKLTKEALFLLETDIEYLNIRD